MRSPAAVLSLFLAWQLLLAAGCSGYRFVDPVPAGRISLKEIRNSTAEPALARILEESLRAAGIRRGDGGKDLYLAIIEFADRVDSIASDGTPIRHEVTMTVLWRLEKQGAAGSPAGEESASLSYPYSADTATLDWNRRAAVRQLCAQVADLLRNTLGDHG